MSSISQGLSVIRIPTRIQAELRNKKLKKTLDRKKILSSSRTGDKSIPIISCKNKELNFFKGQTFGKFDQVPLASRNWNGRKCYGDYFSINKFGKNPAFANKANDSEEVTFEDLGLDVKLEERFKEMGFSTPTNIQCVAIPQILKGSNSVIAAETGNGKTYSYLAPIIHNLVKWKERKIPESVSYNSPKALIIVPGRELVIQTRDMARDLAKPFDLNVNSIVGGKSKKLLLNPHLRNIDVLVSSFGTLSKLITHKLYNLRRLEHIVLDEADTLLDDSFNEQLVHFLSKIPIQGKAIDDEFVTSENVTGVQLTLAGATFPTSIKSILKDIVEVDSLTHLKTSSLHRLPVHIKHNFYRVRDMDKNDRFLQLAKANYINKIPTVVFCNTSICSDFVSLFLNGHDIPCLHLNGALPFHIRKNQFSSFRDRKTYFLSTTDIGSRGLNTTWVEHVINFDCPNFISDYVHRCGRTGRVGSSSSSTVSTFVASKPAQIQLVQEIEYAVRKQCDLPNVNANIKRKLVGTAEKIEELRELEKEISEQQKSTEE